MIASAQVLPRSCSRSTAWLSSTPAVFTSGIGSVSRAVARAASAIVAASSSPLSANSRTHSPRPGDHALRWALPHLAPQREEPGDGAGVLRDRALLAQQLQHPDPHLGEEAGDPPVDEQAPGEVAGVVEPVGVDEVAHRGAQVRQLESELCDRVRLTGPAQPRGDAGDEAAVVVGVRGAHASASPRAFSRPRAYSRTIASSEKTARPSISVCFTSEASTSAASPSSPLPSHERPTPTASTASRVNRVAKTPRSSSSSRWSSGSRPTLQSIAARIVRCRSGRSRTAAVSSGRLCSRRCAMPRGLSSRTFAAASSMASGRPSSRRQMSMMSAAFSSVMAKPGLTAAARSTKSMQAEERSARSRLGDAVGIRRRAAPRRRTPARRGSAARCGSSPGTSPAAPPPTGARCTGAASTICSKLSSTTSTRRPASACAMRSSSAASPLSRMPRAYAIAGTSSPGSRTPSSSTKYVPSGKRSSPRGARSRSASRLLPMPPGPIRLRTRRRVACEQVAHRVRGPPRARSWRCTGRGCACRATRLPLRARRRPRPRVSSNRSASSVDEVAGDLLLELLGRVERQVGRGVVGADAVDQLDQPLLAVRGRLDVDELGHRRRREVVLVLEPGHLLIGGDPAVALGVDADEDVGLREVRAVERARRVRPCAELEHHRSQVQPLDRRTSRAPLVGELAQGRADEDPESLIGSADHRARRVGHERHPHPAACRCARGATGFRRMLTTSRGVRAWRSRSPAVPEQQLRQSSVPLPRARRRPAPPGRAHGGPRAAADEP